MNKFALITTILFLTFALFLYAAKIKPEVVESKCSGCNVCVTVCPVKAIKINKSNKAEIITKKCIDCKLCISSCENKAIK